MDDEKIKSVVDDEHDRTTGDSPVEVSSKVFIVPVRRQRRKRLHLVSQVGYDTSRFVQDRFSDTDERDAPSVVL